MPLASRAEILGKEVVGEKAGALADGAVRNASCLQDSGLVQASRRRVPHSMSCLGTLVSRSTRVAASACWDVVLMLSARMCPGPRGLTRCGAARIRTTSCVGVGGSCECESCAGCAVLGCRAWTLQPGRVVTFSDPRAAVQSQVRVCHFSRPQIVPILPFPPRAYFLVLLIVESVPNPLRSAFPSAFLSGSEVKNLTVSDMLSVTRGRFHTAPRARVHFLRS